MSKNFNNLTLLSNKICTILLKEWDPIGIKDIPEAQDEYNSYVPLICELLMSEASEKELFKYLCHIETELMGLSCNEKHNKIIAQKLKECFTAILKNTVK